MPLALIAIQPDRPGLAEGVSRIVHRHGGNISTSRMVALGGEFVVAALLTAVDGNEDSLAQRLVGELEAEGFTAIVRPTQLDGAGQHVPYRVRAAALDHPGIVEAITQTIRDAGGNIIDAATDLTPSPWSGVPTFSLRATVLVGSSAAARTLKEALADKAAAENLDIEVEPTALQER